MWFMFRRQACASHALRNTHREELEAGEKLCGQQEEDAALGDFFGCSPTLLSIIGKLWGDDDEPGDLDIVAYFQTSPFGDGLELIPRYWMV